MHVTLKENYLTLHWDKEVSTNFWLYDNAPERRHENGQKLTESRSVNLPIKPQKVDWTDEILRLYWEGETSDYPFDFLKSSFAPKPYSRILWKATYPHRIHDFSTVLHQPSFSFAIRTYASLL